VKHLGQAHLQVLVAARAAARAEGVTFEMVEFRAVPNEMVAPAGLDAVLEPAEGAVRSLPATA
jgi:FAD synthase